MAIALIKSNRTIEALKPGYGRLSDGGGLYLLPSDKTAVHYWRCDYSFSNKRQTLSLGVYPKVGLALARQRAAELRQLVAAGGDPAGQRKLDRKQLAANREAEKRLVQGEAPIDSFEEVARRWFAVRKAEWVEGYSSKVIRRLELHVFPYIGREMTRMATQTPPGMATSKSPT